MPASPVPAGQCTQQATRNVARLYATNLKHPLTHCNLLASTMAARKRGSIVLFGSIAGLRGNAAIGHYAITKAAIAQLARNLAVEWGPTDVRSNCVAPGLVATEWADAIIGDPAARDNHLVQTPLRRVAEPHEIASVALFLASEASNFITGQTIVAYGGTLISDGN